MTDIEELVRESLRTAPPVVPSASDPIDAVSRRVRRARGLWGGGFAAAVAVVVTAIVVPLSVGGVSAGRDRVVPSAPSSSPAVPPDASGVTVWQTSDAVAVTAGGGWIWELERDPAARDGAGYVVKVDPRTHQQLQKWKVARGYEQLAYGGGVVWVWTVSTHSDVAVPGGVVQAVDVQHDEPVARYVVSEKFTLDSLDVLDQPTGRADGLIVVGKTLLQLRALGGVMSVVSAKTNGGGVVATGSGDYWMWSAGHLLELATQPDGSRLIASPPKDSVEWSGGLVAPDGPNGIWTYDGSRLIGLSPALLHQGESVAQGDRITLPGSPGAVVPDGSGGWFVVIEQPGFVPPNSDRPGLYHLSKAMIDAGAAVTSSTPSLPDVSPAELAPDGHGGVDFVTDEGVAEHWQP